MSEVTINNLDDADKAMKKIGEHQRAIEAANKTLTQTVEAAQAAAKEQSEPHSKGIEELTAAVEAFVKEHRADVLGKAKSKELNHGKFGFRSSTSIVPRLASGWEGVLKKLKQAGEEAYIRTKEEVNKAAFKGLDKDRLKQLGVKPETKETFFLQAAAAEVKET